MTEQGRAYAEALRTNWWIVVVTALVGALVAGGLALAAPAEYQSTASIVVDTATVAKEARLPKPDAMVAIAQGPEFLEELTSSQDAAFELEAYTTGNPQDHVVIAIHAADELTAAKIAKAAGVQLIGEYQAIAEPLVASDLASLEANKAALEALGEGSKDDKLTSFFRWNVAKADITERESMSYVQNAYSYDGEVASGPSSRNTTTGAAVLGGGLFGLFLGLVIVWLRERGAARDSAAA